jgi:hypothetical protein
MNKYLKIVTFLLVSATVLLPCGTLEAAGTTNVSVSGPLADIAPGSQFTINISIQPDKPIAGAQFSLSFDPALVTVNSVSEGDLLKQNGANTFFAPGNIDNNLGSISGVSGAIISPGNSASSPGNLAVIKLVAKSIEGTCSFALSSVVVGDINGQSLPIGTTDAIVKINKPPLILDQAPVLGTIGSKSINTWSLLSFVVSATDADKDTLTYSASNLPPGASFKPSTHTFSWKPTSKQVGTFPGVHFEVTDGNAIDSEDITITVSQPVLIAKSVPDRINFTSGITQSPVTTNPPNVIVNSDTMSQQIEGLPQGAVVEPTAQQKTEVKAPENSEVQTTAESPLAYSPVSTSPPEVSIGDKTDISAADSTGTGATIPPDESQIEPAVPAQTGEMEFRLSLLIEIIGGALATMWITLGLILLYRRHLLHNSTT